MVAEAWLLKRERGLVDEPRLLKQGLIGSLLSQTNNFDQLLGLFFSSMKSDGLVSRKWNQGFSVGGLLIMALHHFPIPCESSDVDPFGLSGNGFHLLLTSAGHRAKFIRCCKVHQRIS